VEFTSSTHTKLIKEDATPSFLECPDEGNVKLEVVETPLIHTKDPYKTMTTKKGYLSWQTREKP